MTNETKKVSRAIVIALAMAHAENQVVPVGIFVSLEVVMSVGRGGFQHTIFALVTVVSERTLGQFYLSGGVVRLSPAFRMDPSV